MLPASAPVPRAGGIAEGEAATVAKVLIAKLTDGSDALPYDGAAGCYVELGNDLVGRIDVNFLSYDTPVARPLSSVSTSRAIALVMMRSLPVASAGGSSTDGDEKFEWVAQPRPHWPQ